MNSMDNLKALFTARDGKSAPSLPQPPTIREMIEDIERINDNDPVLVFAELLRKHAKKAQRLKSKQSNSEELSSDSDNETDQDEKLTDSGSTTSSKTRSAKKPSKIWFPPLDELHSFGLEFSDHHANANASLSPTTSKNISQEQIHHANETYNRLRQLRSLIDKSENLLEEIEPKIKTLGIESKSYFELVENKMKESDSDKPYKIEDESFKSSIDDLDDEEEDSLT